MVQESVCSQSCAAVIIPYHLPLKALVTVTLHFPKWRSPRQPPSLHPVSGFACSGQFTWCNQTARALWDWHFFSVCFLDSYMLLHVLVLSFIWPLSDFPLFGWEVRFVPWTGGLRSLLFATGNNASLNLPSILLWGEPSLDMYLGMGRIYFCLSCKVGIWRLPSHLNNWLSQHRV